MSINHNWLEEYKKAIRAKYEVEKSGVYSSFLLIPSRAQLRKLCVERFKENLNSDDLISFKLFFGFEFASDNLNKLKTQTDKFRPLETFLKGETELTDLEGLNIAAILVNFNPRPFNKFNKSDFSVFEDNFKEDIKTTIPLQKEFKINSFSAAANTGMSSKKTNNKSNNKKAGIVALILTGLFSVGYTTKNMFFKEKECMQWKENHYELVDCKSDNIILTNNCKPEPYNKDEFARKKLKVCDTTTFFKADKPIVWYCKKNNSVCFFNMDGKNPENGTELKQITQHMIDKYVLPLQ